MRRSISGMTMRAIIMLSSTSRVEAISAIWVMTMMEVEGIIGRETGVLGVYHGANISWVFLHAMSGYQIISSAFFKLNTIVIERVNIVSWRSKYLIHRESLANIQ
jgi:hypothetical protein